MQRPSKVAYVDQDTLVQEPGPPERRKSMVRRLSQDLVATVDSIKDLMVDIRQKLHRQKFSDLPDQRLQAPSLGQRFLSIDEEQRSSEHTRRSHHGRAGGNNKSSAGWAHESCVNNSKSPLDNREMGNESRRRMMMMTMNMGNKFDGATDRKSERSFSDEKNDNGHNSSSRSDVVSISSNTSTNFGKRRGRGATNSSYCSSTGCSTNRRLEVPGSRSISYEDASSDPVFHACSHDCHCSEYTLRHPKRNLGTRSLSSDTAPEEKAGKCSQLIVCIPMCRY